MKEVTCDNTCWPHEQCESCMNPRIYPNMYGRCTPWTDESINIAESKRTFPSGATRDTDTDKLDYEGFESPLVMRRYAEYMHSCRKLADGTQRASDNWKAGIPIGEYLKSMFRHFMEVLLIQGQGEPGDLEKALCALRFNVNGMLHEILKAKRG